MSGKYQKMTPALKNEVLRILNRGVSAEEMAAMPPNAHHMVANKKASLFCDKLIDGRMTFEQVFEIARGELDDPRVEAALFIENVVTGNYDK